MTAATWGCCPAPRHTDELLTRGDVCHVHADRAAAERCGVLLGRAPELVRLDEVRPAVYRATWSLSSAGLTAYSVETGDLDEHAQQIGVRQDDGALLTARSLYWGEVFTTGC